MSVIMSGPVSVSLPLAERRDRGTGAQCLASCALTPGSVPDRLWNRPNEGPAAVTIEHASGQIDVLVDFRNDTSGFEIRSAGLVRTARKIAVGEVFVPASV